MKKFTGLLLAAVLCLPAYAAQTKNTMKMVSYFPVPYVAYDTVSANNAMDIGILNQCEMDINKGSTNLGGSACSLYLYGNATGADLNRGLLNVAAGKLDLNSNVTNARIVQVGALMTEENGWLDVKIPSGKNDEYDALYISSLKNTGNSFRVTSKEDGAKVNSFHMFNEISNDFPGCAGTVTWQELELAANVNSNETYTDIYLVCNGTGETTEPEECQPPRGNTYTENCPSGQTGTITYTWNQSTCSYDETQDTCANVCEWSAGSWSSKPFTQGAEDTCYDSRPYSSKYFDEADLETQKQIGKACTDWKMTSGYSGQISTQYVSTSITTPCPGVANGSIGVCQGSSNYDVCHNMSGEFSVNWDHFIYKNTEQYLVTDTRGISCSMGGSSNTVFGCLLPSNKLAYVCYSAKVRTIQCK